MIIFVSIITHTRMKLGNEGTRRMTDRERHKLIDAVDRWAGRQIDRGIDR